MKCLISSKPVARNFTVKASHIVGSFDASEIEECYACDNLISGSEEVHIDDDDANVEYLDVDGGLGQPGEVYTLEELKDYWNNNRYSDPILEEYESFTEWFMDTSLKEVSDDDGAGGEII